MAGRLVLVLGDQLDRGGAAFDGFERGRDRVWMAEVAGESTQVWSRACSHCSSAGTRGGCTRPSAAGTTSDGSQMPASSIVAKVSLSAPMTPKDHRGSPCVSLRGTRREKNRSLSRLSV